MGVIADIQDDLDKGALRLIAEYRARLHAEAVKLCGNETTAEDLVFRTFDRAIRNIRDCKGEETLFAWMRAILQNLYLDDGKRAVNRGTVAVDAKTLEECAGCDEEFLDRMERNLDCEAVREALNMLDPEYREAVSLYYLGGHTLVEIAALLGSSKSSVARKIELGCQILAEKLKVSVSRKKKPLAVLGALLLGVATLFGAYQTGFVDAVKSYFTAEMPAPEPITETFVASSAPEADVSNYPTSNSEQTSAVVSVEPITTFENNNENTETKGEEPMKLTKTVKTVAVAAAMTIGSARAEAQVFYVDAASTSPAAPYANPETAATTIRDAYIAVTNALEEGAASAAEIRVATGTYTETDFILDQPIAIVGETGDPADVEIVDQVRGKRAFTLSHALAAVRGLTISGEGLNSSNDSGYGGHIYMTAGIVANCVIKGGIAVTCGYESSGHGGNVYMSGGQLTRCRVQNGKTNGLIGNWRDQRCFGAGIFASGGVVDNCLVTGNGSNNERYYGGGIYANGTAQIVNCTVIGNGRHNIYVDASTVKVANSIFFAPTMYVNGSEASLGGLFTVYSHCASDMANASCDSWRVIQSSDFVGYLNGDYHLSAATLMMDAGTCDEAWVPPPQPEVDLDGFTRVSGTEIDIGCYEFDQSKVSAGGYASAYSAFETSNIVFHASAKGGSGAGFEYKWDFGDGAVIETELTDYTYAYPTSGLYRIRVTAREKGSDEWAPWFETVEKLVVAPTTMYVDTACGTPTFPYKTKATAAHSFADIFAALTNNVSEGRSVFDGVTIVVCKGKHAITGAILDRPITIVGETGNPADVEIVDQVAGKRALTMSHADAVVRGLTISGTGYSYWGTTDCGGHVYMSAGLVENCVIRDGIARDTTYERCYGGNVYMTGGRLSHCQILNGRAKRTDSLNQTGFGGGVYASGGIIENCLVAKNGKKCNNADYGDGIYADGAVRIVNCTVIDNVTGNIYVNNANARIVNCIFFGCGENDVGGQKTCFSHCAASVTNASCATWQVIQNGDFAGYLAEDYHLSAATLMMDAGTQDGTWVPAPQATTDLVGFQRVSGAEIDLGCYEFDQSSVSVGGYASAYGAFETSNIVFHASAKGGSGAGFEYKWDFGDGEIVTTELTDYTYAYPTSGLYRIRVTAREKGSDEWAPWFETVEKLVVAPTTMYVDTACGTPTFPYKTKATAAHSFADALNSLTNNVSAGCPVIPGAVICVCKGSHAFSGMTLNGPVTIKGETGNPKDVTIVDQVSGKRAFTLSHALAAVRGLTISGTGLAAWESNSSGGHIYMTAGLVENCIIKGGCCGNSLEVNNARGGNVYMSGGRLSHCQIMDGKVQLADYTYRTGHGGGIYASGGIIENCLVMKNGRGKDPTDLGGGLFLVGTAQVVNCTVVDNNTQGIYIDNSGDVKVVNSVFYGNALGDISGYGTYKTDFSHCAASVANASCATWRVIDENAFWKYDQREKDLKYLRPSMNGGLHNTGTTWAEYLATGAASELDLLNHPRIIGKHLDLGAFEGAPSGGVFSVR